MTSGPRRPSRFPFWRGLASYLCVSTAVVACAPTHAVVHQASDTKKPTLSKTVQAESFTDGSEDPELVALFAELDEARRIARIPGITYVLWQADGTAIVHSQGVKDVHSGVPVGPDTRFAIASLTKAFTSMLAVIASDRGQLDLDAHPRQCLAGFAVQPPQRDKKLTVRDMLAHTSAQPRDSGVSIVRGTREQVVAHAMTMRPVEADVGLVGERFHYSNAMTAVAGECIANAMGGQYEALLIAEILRPLGMKDAGFEARDEDAIGHAVYAAVPAQGKFEGFVLAEDAGLGEASAPGGGLFASGADMVHWLRYWIELGRADALPLERENLGESVQPRLSPKKSGAGYGLGWSLAYRLGRRVWQHTGSINSQQSIIVMAPDLRVGFVIMANAGYHQFKGKVADRILAHLVGDEAKTIKLEIDEGPVPSVDTPRLDERTHELSGVYVKQRPAPSATEVIEPPSLLRVFYDGERVYLGLDAASAQVLVLDSESRGRLLSAKQARREIVAAYEDGAGTRPGKPLSILRDTKGRATGFRLDEGGTWSRAHPRKRGGAAPSLAKMRQKVERAHGFSAYDKLLPLKFRAHKDLWWFGAITSWEEHVDREKVVEGGVWTVMPELALPWWNLNYADPSREDLKLLGWKRTFPGGFDRYPMDSRRWLDAEPVGWAWDSATSSSVLGKIVIGEGDLARELVLVLHEFKGGHVVLDAYDAKNDRLMWRRVRKMGPWGKSKVSWLAYDSWQELEGVLLPLDMRFGSGARKSTRKRRDYEARVPFTESELVPPGDIGLKPQRERARLHPKAVEALRRRGE